METRANYLSVGAFIVALCLGGLVFILWISQVDFSSDRHTYLIYFKGSVAGLRVHDKVRFHGIPIGRIKKISVDETNVERVLVHVSIDQAALVREDTVAFVEAQGLTGYSYVHLKGGTQQSPLLQAKSGDPFPVIASQVSGLEKLFETLPTILTKIDDLSQRFHHLLSPSNLQDFSKSLRHVAQITEQMASGPSSLVGFIQQATTTLASVETVLKGVNETLQGEDLERALQSIGKVARELNRFLVDNRGAVQQFTSVGLEDFTRLMGETRETVTTLNRVLLDLEQSPGNFLNKNTSQGYQLP